MAKLNESPIVEVTSAADDDLFYALRTADASLPDKRIKWSNILSQTATLLNKTIGAPATLKPVYTNLLQIVGAKVSHIYRAADSITISALAAEAEETLTLAVTGAAVGDHVILSPTAAPEAGVCLAAAWVSADDTVSVRVQNNSSGSLTGGSLAVTALVIRSAAPDA